ncbi:MAG: hypothetical protein WCT85_07405, partial [Parachlamydiales bacterium]
LITTGQISLDQETYQRIWTKISPASIQALRQMHISECCKKILIDLDDEQVTSMINEKRCNESKNEYNRKNLEAIILLSNSYKHEFLTISAVSIINNSLSQITHLPARQRKIKKVSFSSSLTNEEKKPLKNMNIIMFLSASFLATAAFFCYFQNYKKT